MLEATTEERMIEVLVPCHHDFVNAVAEGRGKDGKDGETQIDSPCQAITRWLLV